MPKKGLSYNSPPKRMPNPADLRVRFPEIMAQVRKEYKSRMSAMLGGIKREGKRKHKPDGKRKGG